MPQNATPSADALTPSQEKALSALLVGKSVTDAAAAAEVDRTTVHRWLKDDFGFRAAFNRERHRLREAMQSRLMTLAEKAAECVERSLADGDGKTALALLKGLGLLSGELPPVGSDDPADLAAAARRNELFRSL
jgi:hypothetical protein